MSIAGQSTSDPERFRLGMAEKAVWRKATGPVFRGRPPAELASALCAELADPELLIEQAEAALLNLRAGQKSGLRFFLDDGRERFAHALAKILRLAPRVLRGAALFGQAARPGSRAGTAHLSGTRPRCSPDAIAH